MSIDGHRWLMTAVNAPLERAAFHPEPGPGEVVVAIAGCGVCHTDLGYFYDGVRTNHPLPLALGHEISGRVVAAGAGAARLDRQGRHRPRGAALRRVRPVPARPRHDLPGAEDAGQRHPGRLRHAHRRARARPVRGRRGAPRPRRPHAAPKCRSSPTR